MNHERHSSNSGNRQKSKRQERRKGIQAQEKRQAADIKGCNGSGNAGSDFSISKHAVQLWRDYSILWVCWMGNYLHDRKQRGENMTDAEIMARLRNISLEMLQIAQEKGIEIGVTVYPDKYDKYVRTRAGDYEYLSLQGKESFRYEPLDNVADWKNIELDQVNFDGKPKDKRKTPEAATPGAECNELIIGQKRRNVK